MWAHEESIETTATPTQIWRLFSDVASWKKWNSGVKHIEIHGPFADGTTFSMQIPGGHILTSTLLDVKENESFSDKTVIKDTHVVVEHNIICRPSGQNLIRYRTVIDGPDAEELGPMVTGDFKSVLTALKTLAENGR